MLAVWIVLIFCSVALCLYLYLRHSFSYWKRRNVPFRLPKLIVGNIFEILMGKYSPAKYITQLCDECEGPYVGFFVLHKPYLAIKDPGIIKKILVTDFQKFPDKIFINDNVIDPTFSNSLLSLGSAQWKSVRTKLSRIFSPAKIKVMFVNTEMCAKTLCSYIESKLNERVDLKDLSTRFSTEVVLSCVFGISSNCFAQKRSECNFYAHKIFPKAFVGLFKGFSYVFLPDLVKIFKYQFFDPAACEFFQKVFLETIEHRETWKFKRNDLVDILINIKNQHNYTSEAVLAQAVAFLGVGHETISAIMALTLYELCITESIQDRLREEIQTISESKITLKVIDDMKYLNMVICESLRKYPVIPFIQRKCIEDYFITETETVLEKGTSIIIPTHWLHYNPTFFPEPNKYNPDRFADENVTINPYAYLPFSAGPRVCLGRRFALMCIKVCLIYLIKHFKIKKHETTKDQLAFGSSHALDPKNGIPIKFEKL